MGGSEKTSVWFVAVVCADWLVRRLLRSFKGKACTSGL